MKTNDSLEFAVLTGCMRISKESIFIGLNNLKVLSVADMQFYEYFGFTDSEVRELLKYYELSLNYEDVKEWYDGYRFGNVEVYCPWDAVNYCDELRADSNALPQNYWSNTSSNEVVRKFIQRADMGTTKNEIERLVAGDFAVINADDEYAARFMEVVSPTVSLYTYGIKMAADVRAKDVLFNHDGASFTCCVKGNEYKVKLKMNGMFSVYNVLAAITTALALGFDIEKSIKTLETLGGVAGRFEVVLNKPTVIVDYAHTPDGLENVLKAARDIKPSDGKLICIFGCGGDRDATKRPKMGRIAEELADKVIVTSDNPRSEDPQQIITDILAGFKSVNNVIVEPDRELAIKEAKKIAAANDVVLVAGKGHEDYQILANETIHFDDREKVKEIFGA